MTARDIFEYALVELSKVNAPSLMLSEYNYYINKAVSQYINKRYNIYDINQQTTDDLRVLKSTASIPITENNRKALHSHNSNYEATYEFELPEDYLHMLNCICVYQLGSRYRCYDQGDIVEWPAKRLTADLWSQVQKDYYNNPKPWRPYYYIHHRNPQLSRPTNPIEEGNNFGTDPTTENHVFKVVTGYTYTDASGEKQVITKDKGITQQEYLEEIAGLKESGAKDFVPKSQFIMPDDPLMPVPPPDEPELDLSIISGTYKRTVKLDRFTTSNDSDVSNIEKNAALRYGNTSAVRCEIRYGKDNRVYKLVEVLVDYIKAPQYIRLTQEQVDITTDTSQILEFPDYVCQEIINELVTLLMERSADPRLQTQPAVSQSIANPAQQQAAPQPQQRRG